MANPHLKSAATNLRQASDDLMNSAQQVQAEANQLKRDMEKRLDRIRFEQNTMNRQLRTAPTTSMQADFVALNGKLENEKKELEKSIYETQDKARKQVESINSQINDFNNLAEKLENTD